MLSEVLNVMNLLKVFGGFAAAGRYVTSAARGQARGSKSWFSRCCLLPASSASIQESAVNEAGLPSGHIKYIINMLL